MEPRAAEQFQLQGGFLLSLEGNGQRNDADNQSSDGKQNAEKLNIAHSITSASVRRCGGNHRQHLPAYTKALYHTALHGTRRFLYARRGMRMNAAEG